MMDIRLIFRNHIVRVISEGVTQKGKPAHVWMCGLKLVGRFPRQTRGAVNPERRARVRRKAGEAAQLRCPENPRRECTV
jgi:hypothetical protein